jgi:C_GCAxxG_C_C family probable redox protein
MKKEVNIKKIRSDAEEAFKAGDFLCAEAVINSIRQNIVPDMPKEFISAASGFSIGVGGAQCMCSTVSAAVMCLGYFFGRDFPTTPTDPQSQKTLELAYELQESFKNKNKVLCCHVHNKGKDMSSGEHLAQCASFVGDATTKVAEIIARELKIAVVEGRV